MVRAVIRVPYAAEESNAGSLEPASFSNRSGSRHIMSKIPSLVFDMEDTEEGNLHHTLSSSNLEDPLAEVVQKLTSLLDPWSEAEYMVLLHIRIAREEAAKRGQAQLSVAELADTLRRLGYSVKMRTALGGGWGGACLRNLRHSFLTVAVEGPNGNNVPLVVDPRFREQFEIAHSTGRYQQVLQVVPVEAVVPQQRLNAAVEILCKEMAAAFQQTGTPLPPWRQQPAMMSKWEPRRSEEVDLPSDQNDVAALLNNALGAPPTRQALHTKNTIAQKLAMLGIEPANASPISEGLEDLDVCSREWGSSSSTSGHDVAVNDVSNNVDASEITSAVQQIPTSQVWEGIKSAVAVMPERRNTWA